VSAYVEEHRERFGVEPICSTLGVSASAYYQRKTSRCSARSVEDERLLTRIREVRANGIQGAKRRGKPWRTTIPDPDARRRPDLLNREFTASAPNELWVADFSYLRCWEGVVFFSFVIDVYSRMVVGWQFASHMRTTLVLDALWIALSTRNRVEEVRLIHHSDRGSQYVSGDYTQTLADHDVLASVGSTGDAYDNSMAESFVDTFNPELITDRVWHTRSQLELAIVEYIAWFNNTHLHENLEDRPPREIEELYAVKRNATITTS
jgi:putative transposase